MQVARLACSSRSSSLPFLASFSQAVFGAPCFNGSDPGVQLTAATERSASRGGDSQLCGRGDKRTKKGKRFKGSFGNCRHRKSWETQRLREKWEIPAGPLPGSILPRPFPPVLSRY